MELKFYRCPHCGNIVVKLHDSNVPVVCCGQPMEELKAGVSDGATEKHVPVVITEGNQVTVKVGEVTHPSIDAHYIEFIVLETSEGFQVKHLKPGQEPKAIFAIADNEKVVAAYEYCNLHGLWKK